MNEGVLPAYESCSCYRVTIVCTEVAECFTGLRAIIVVICVTGACSDVLGVVLVVLYFVFHYRAIFPPPALAL